MLFSPQQNEVAERVVTLAQSRIAQEVGVVVSIVMQFNWDRSCFHDLSNL